eukprot:GHVU01209616.1.p2 GENE.GHVU01209616.1~~GHVU01209616.1.p2  ORF type:complete len:105 (-),score=13.30 GHVU01209616.1:365-679(-)
MRRQRGNVKGSRSVSPGRGGEDSRDNAQSSNAAALAARQPQHGGGNNEPRTCLYCRWGGWRRTAEDWVQCPACDFWAHATCAPVRPNESVPFMCKPCRRQQQQQ